MRLHARTCGEHQQLAHDSGWRWRLLRGAQESRYWLTGEDKNRVFGDSWRFFGGGGIGCIYWEEIFFRGVEKDFFRGAFLSGGGQRPEERRRF